MTRSQRVTVGLAVVVLLLLFYLLKPVLTPFLIAALLAYLGDPLVVHLVRLKIPRTLAATLVFIVIMLVVLALLLLLVPLLGKQVGVFIAKVPQLLQWAQAVGLPWLNQYLGDSSINIPDLQTVKTTIISHWQQASNVAAIAWRTLSQSSLALIGWVAKLLLIPVVTFYLLRDWDQVIKGARQLLPRQFEPTLVNLARECNEVLSAFFRGQLLVMLALAIIYTIGLKIVGLDLALLIGCIAGVLTIVPYLGITIGILMASIAALVQFQDGLHLLYVAIVFVVGHVAESTVLTPWLVGDRIGLHPVAVIFAVLVGGHLFGFVGVLLALPVAAVLMVLLRHMRQRYINSHLYNAR